MVLFHGECLLIYLLIYMKLKTLVMALILPCVWSGQSGAGQGCWLIAAWPIGPAELPPEGHVLSGPCPLHIPTTYPGSRPCKLADAHTHTHTHKLCAPLAPRCGGGQGLACHSGSGVRGGGGGAAGSRRERDGKIVFDQSQPPILLMEKVTTPRPPPVPSPLQSL